MCVIAYKAKDVRFPSEKNVREMWEHNPDGAGVMWRHEDGRIRYTKGFMKLKNLEKWIARNRAWLEEVECALHFRITTHGGTSPGNCHPFVAETHSDPHSLNGVADRVLMHNGILPLKPRAKDISDSAELALRLGEYDDAAMPMRTLNETLAGNRIVLMDENGTHFFGDPFRKSERAECAGILYSNLNHEPFSFACKGGGEWSDAGHSFRPGAYYDEREGVFRERFTGKALRIEDVDPCELSDEDYEIWECAYSSDGFVKDRCRLWGVSPKEYHDLEIEAESCGMNVEDYMQMLCEDDSAFSETEAGTRVSA